jgi:hypothetical protein
VKKSHASMSRAKARRLAMVAHKSPATHIHATAETAKVHTTTGTATAKDESVILEQKVKRSAQAWDWWKALWALFGPIFAVITFYSNFTPAISIAPGPNLDRTQSYFTQILITNTGHLPVYDVSFACGFGASSGTVHIGRIDHSTQNIAPVQRLSPGQSTTKDCAVASDVQGDANLTFTISYKWPLIGWLSGWQESKSAKFDVKEGRDGHFLVPSASPR